MRGPRYKRILIAGAGGLLGRHIAAHLSEPRAVTAHGHGSLDITDAQAVERACARERPELIINCAVLGVDASERDPERAHAVNVTGPENLALAAKAIDAELLHFSSNYVFDGAGRDGAPYTAPDAPSPINRYGQSKLAGELAVHSACARSFIVRSSWVFGAGKAGFVNETARRLRRQERVDAITDVWANATFVADLVLRALQVVSCGRYGTYHVVNSGVCSYYEIAVEVGRLLDVSSERLAQLIGSAAAADASWQARRPRCTPLRCLASEELGLPAMRHWRLALADYVHGR